MFGFLKFLAILCFLIALGFVLNSSLGMAGIFLGIGLGIGVLQNIFCQEEVREIRDQRNNISKE